MVPAAVSPEQSANGSSFFRRYRNRRLGDFLKELDLTEGKATGIPIIKRALLKPEAAFETDEDRSYFQVILRIHPEFLEMETVGKADNNMTSKILNLIKSNPYWTREELAIESGLSVRGIEYHLKILKDSKKIVRKGFKGGHWEVDS